MRLGRLTKIDPREVWLSEPQHFTPWLAREENIELLAETLGLELEVEAQEKQVGPFRADKETAKAFYHQLHLQRHEIEAELGYALEWRELPDKQACRILLMRDNSALQSREQWPEYLQWLISTLEDFDRVFRDRVRSLNETVEELEQYDADNGVG